MPLWDIHTTPNLLSPTEKKDLAKSITRIYVKRGPLPAFYVNVRFTTLPAGDTFIGGTEPTNSALIQIWHLARQFQSDTQKQTFMAEVDKVLNPLLGEEGKGAHWEYFIQESPRDLWKINGMVPPLPGTEMERRWVEENKAVPESKL